MLPQAKRLLMRPASSADCASRVSDAPGASITKPRILLCNVVFVKQAYGIILDNESIYFGSAMTAILLQVNQLLAAIVLIVAFSLLSYIALQNWRAAIARALAILLGCVVVVNGGDVLLNRAQSVATIQFLLRAQWLGIAMVPAAYLHLATALIGVSRGEDARRRWFWMVWPGYGLSMAFFVLALQTDLILRGGIPDGPLAQFGAGPLFALYVLYFIGGVLVALRAILDARRNALTPSLRRRMTYLGITFAAPGLGVFPYMVIAGAYESLSLTILLLLSSLASIAVIGMMTVMTYSVAFQGMLLPDRLIKQDFIRWGLYGPVVGITVILFMQVVPWLELRLGLPSDTLLTFGVMIMTVLMPIFVSRVKPYLDALVYMQDRAEIDYLRNLPRSTFTRTDLRQLLENSLIAVCGALRVETGFVVGPGEQNETGERAYSVKAACGSRRDVKRFVAEHPLIYLMLQLERVRRPNAEVLPPADTFLTCSSFCMLPLHSPDGNFLGALGVAMPAEAMRNGELPAEARRLIRVLAHQMELALTTVEIQQRIFDALRGLGPEMQSLQQLSTRLEQATPASLADLETDIAMQPEFPQIVKDALTHYWGGPKLSDSPLLDLRTVRRAIQDQGGGSPTRALQSVLRQAIDNMRPDEQLDPSAQEWLLYNILEMRFLQGRRIREVASKLAMSESDFYRKQRVAVEEVARQLALMEDGERLSISEQNQ